MGPRARGVDDVLWISSDGYALEGPTSTLIWLDGGDTVDGAGGPTGILAGTTARWLLDHAGALGWRSAERMVTPEQLTSAEGVWFVSSIRGLAEIRAIDGVARPEAADTTRIRALLGYPIFI